MNYDSYSEVINGESTYRDIADTLKDGKSVLVGWTDQAGTHFDILFTRHAIIGGSNIQGGVYGNDLFISILRMGAFGFDVRDSDTHSGYYAEKLGFTGQETADKFAELVNGVKKALI